MLDNPYQSPLPEQEPPRIYASRFAAARSGALRGGLWAAKWTAIVFGPLLFLPVAGLVIGLYWWPATRKAGLRLDLREEAIKPAESGATPIVPGKPDQSEAVRRVFAADEGEVMPPPEAHKALTAEQKETFKRWVEQGAVYEKHWSFQPAVKPPMPRIDDPVSGVRNPIDAFIAERLRREALTLSTEADRETLIRRVSFALIGLPPTLDEVDRYLADTSPDAYETMVDRYLASPRFGEELARHWLDLARYADTHGLHLDNERQMWPYRDWVVRAFDENKPFDQFTIEQLAGDLLPPAGLGQETDREQLVATGFIRCNVSTSEGGSIEEEWIFRNALDRTTTGVAFATTINSTRYLRRNTTRSMPSSIRRLTRRSTATRS